MPPDVYRLPGLRRLLARFANAHVFYFHLTRRHLISLPLSHPCRLRVKLTDVALVKQLYQRQQEHETPVAGGAGNAVQAQLRLLARLCFGRTVAAAFLLPLMDLCVRTKLNIIGGRTLTGAEC